MRQDAHPIRLSQPITYKRWIPFSGGVTTCFRSRCSRFRSAPAWWWWEMKIFLMKLISCVCPFSTEIWWFSTDFSGPFWELPVAWKLKLWKFLFTSWTMHPYVTFSIGGDSGRLRVRILGGLDLLRISPKSVENPDLAEHPPIFYWCKAIQTQFFSN